VLYLTDTGRRWDGAKVSVRDKVGQLDSWQLAISRINSKQISRNQEPETRNPKPVTRNPHPETRNPNTPNLEPGTWNLELKFHSSKDIIDAAHLLPDQIMFTFHPQRWTDKPLPWIRELVMQNVKNVAKRVLLNAKF
jgi:hypothetical protein